MATVNRVAGVAGTVDIVVRTTSGALLTPVSLPAVRFYTDAARTLGEQTLTVTGSGSNYTAAYSVAQAPVAGSTRYLKVTIEVSTGIFDVDADDEISFVDATSELVVALATTTNDMLHDARRLLLSGHEEEANQSLGALTASATVLPLKYDLGGIRARTVVAIDLEEIRVWEVNAGTKTATVVERGVNGSVAATHAAGAYVAVSPRWSNFRIVAALNDDLLSLSSPANGLFVVRSVELTYNSAVAGYNLTGVTALDDILQVQAEVSGPTKAWPLLGLHEWELRRDANTTDFASGLALLAWSGNSGRKLRVTYKSAFTPLSLTDVTVNVEVTTGLHAEAHDIPPLGAIERLVGATEIKRNFNESQPEPRRAQEVPPGARQGSARIPAGLRQRRIAEERSRLNRRWPIRSR